MRKWLAHLEFISGPYSIPFLHGVEARTLQAAERKVFRYLKNFYGGRYRRDGNWFFYHYDEVAVKYHGIEEVPKDNEIGFLWNALMPIK